MRAINKFKVIVVVTAMSLQNESFILSLNLLAASYRSYSQNNYRHFKIVCKILQLFFLREEIDDMQRRGGENCKPRF
jgi:hypothetical protein